jgi:hypothetical protein
MFCAVVFLPFSFYCEYTFIYLYSGWIVGSFYCGTHMNSAAVNIRVHDVQGSDVFVSVGDFVAEDGGAPGHVCSQTG